MIESLVWNNAIAGEHAAERELILHSARTQIDTHVILEHAGQTLDWSLVLDQSVYHGVLPLVYSSLRRAGAEVPSPEMSKRFQQAYYSMAVLSQVAAGQLRKLSGELKSAGVDHIVFKGSVLAALAYPEISLRKPGDIDLLVRRSRFAEVSLQLMEEGFAAFASSQSRQPITPAEIPKYALRHKSVTLYHQSATIDLHQTFDDYPFMFGLPMDEVWARKTHVDISGSAIPTLAHEDHFLFLCIHGVKHNWRRLTWLVDLAELMRRNDQIRWDVLRDRARQSGTSQLLNLALILASSLLGVGIPQELSRDVGEDAVGQELAVQLAGWIFREPSPREINRFRLRILPGISAKAGYLVHRLKSRF